MDDIRKMLMMCNSDPSGRFWHLACRRGGGQKLCEGTKEPSSKSLDSDENCKPEHKLFCCNLKICRNLRTFWKSLGKKCFCLVKNNVF